MFPANPNKNLFSISLFFFVLGIQIHVLLFSESFAAEETAGYAVENCDFSHACFLSPRTTNVLLQRSVSL